jgi:hypothetical protein
MIQLLEVISRYKPYHCRDLDQIVKAINLKTEFDIQEESILFTTHLLVSTFWILDTSLPITTLFYKDLRSSRGAIYSGGPRDGLRYRCCS